MSNGLDRNEYTATPTQVLIKHESDSRAFFRALGWVMATMMTAAVFCGVVYMVANKVI